MSWSFGNIIETVEDNLDPTTPALIHGERQLSWGELSTRSNGLARAFLNADVNPLDKVGFYMRNCPEYIETLIACFKSRLVHVNLNYRYVEDELLYILSNSDAKILVYAAEFADRIDVIRNKLPEVELWVEVPETSGQSVRPYAVSYESLVGDGGERLDIERSGEDQLFIYTGGTTGAPKGVIWQHEALWGASQVTLGSEAFKSLEDYGRHIKENAPGPRQIPVCPLMHGTGLLTGTNTMVGGGTVITLPMQRFDPELLWETVSRERVQDLAIVGDAFAKPMLQALESNPGRFDISSLERVISSGVMWGEESKRGLLAHNPNMVLMDSLGASEGLGFGGSISTGDQTERVSRFLVGPNSKVFNENHEEVVPGSGEIGFLATRGPIPLGYYKDEEKTAKTFPTIDGKRWSVPGDYCRVEDDGTIILLGRGSVCINTAGEKVYPEEVEETLKTHPDVEDALVVGLPDERWGQSVTGVVTLAANTQLDEAGIQSHCRSKLAAYKMPKRIFATDDLHRGVNGKADYKYITAFANEQLTAQTVDQP